MVKLLLSDYQRSKEDNQSDDVFYSQPRFTHHLDPSFRNHLTDQYREIIEQESSILDLMSSWVSHLPKEKKYKHVIGHGLNKQELSANKSLNSYFIQNLNTNYHLPFKDDTFDYCLIVAGWQYLQFPEPISSELSRITVNGGKLLISFTNRAFWTKASRIWVESTDFERIKYISNVVECNGWNVDHVIQKDTSKMQFSLFPLSNDPFYPVISNNLKITN